MLAPSVAHDLAARLRDVGYSYDAVAERLGGSGLNGLARNATIPADRVLAGATDPQATLIRAFALQHDVPRTDLAAALGDLDRLTPILHAAPDDTVSAAIEIRPYAFSDDHGDHSGWLASDLTPTLDGRLAVPRDDFVLGLSPASITLAQLTMRNPRGRALDLGAGCGIQSLHLSTHVSQVIATDLNPRACAMTNLTAALNGIMLDVRQGSLYEPVAGEGFDLIVTNPPYVMAPPDSSHLVYREGSFTADGLVRAVVTGAATHLNPGGALQVLGNWAITADQPWQDRLASWIAPTGCDALVLQRERLDPFEYIEIWLADAGLIGAADYARRYAEWADYLEQLGVVGVAWAGSRSTTTNATIPNFASTTGPTRCTAAWGTPSPNSRTPSARHSCPTTSCWAPHSPSMRPSPPRLSDARAPPTQSTSSSAGPRVSDVPSRSTPAWPPWPEPATATCRSAS